MIDEDIIENLIAETPENARIALNKIKIIQGVSAEEAQALANLFVPFWKSNDIDLKTLANEAFVNLKRQHPSISYPQELMNSTVGVRKMKEKYFPGVQIPSNSASSPKAPQVPPPPVRLETKPTPSPPVSQPESTYSQNKPARREGFRISQYFSEGWETFQKAKFSFIGFTFVSVISCAFAFPIFFMPQIYFAGTILIAFRIMRNEEFEFNDFFCFKYWWPVTNYILETLVYQIPLITYPWVLSWFFAVPFMIAEDIELSEAYKRSSEVLSTEWLSVLGFVLLLLLVIFAGAVLYGVGILVTAPFAHCVLAAAYKDKVGFKS